MPLAAYTHPKACASRLRLALKQNLACTLAVALESFARPIAFLFFFHHVLIVLVVVASVMMMHEDILSSLFFLVGVLHMRFSASFYHTSRRCWRVAAVVRELLS